MGMGFNGCSNCKSSKRGLLTGRNPTDRGKSGVKRHVLTDGRGIPIAHTISGANVHDIKMVFETLDANLILAGKGKKRPLHLCLDKGYDSKKLENDLRRRGIKPHIRKRGENALLGKVKGKARRWVVERTHSWHNRYRAILIRWEKKPENYLALLHLASTLIIFNQII